MAYIDPLTSAVIDTTTYQIYTDPAFPDDGYDIVIANGDGTFTYLLSFTDPKYLDPMELESYIKARIQHGTGLAGTG